MIMVFFFVCSCMIHTLYGSQIYLGDHSTIRTANYYQNLTATIEGSGCYLDLAYASISNKLTIKIIGNSNTVFINHPNELQLSVTGNNCTVNNIFQAAPSSINISGQSIYNDNVGHCTYLFNQYKDRATHLYYLNPNFFKSIVVLGSVAFLAKDPIKTVAITVLMGMLIHRTLYLSRN
jgi:hypothetical protein